MVSNSRFCLISFTFLPSLLEKQWQNRSNNNSHSLVESLVTSRLFCPLFTLCLPSQSMGWKLYSYFLTIRRLQSLILVESIRFHLYFSLIFLGWRRLDSIISLESIPKLPQNLWRAVIILIMIITTVWTNKSQSRQKWPPQESPRVYPEPELQHLPKILIKIFSFNGFSAKRKLGLKKIQQQHLFLMGNFFIISLLQFNFVNFSLPKKEQSSLASHCIMLREEAGTEAEKF